jgi:hypothetical protein
MRQSKQPSPEYVVYSNDCVERVLAFVPPGHLHMRLIVEFCDGRAIVLHEAAVAGIVRAYVNVALHPSRRALELKSVLMEKGELKRGYSRWQLIETRRDEEELLREGVEALSSARLVVRGDKPRGQAGGGKPRQV